MTKTPRLKDQAGASPVKLGLDMFDSLFWPVAGLLFLLIATILVNLWKSRNKNKTKLTFADLPEREVPHSVLSLCSDALNPHLESSKGKGAYRTPKLSLTPAGIARQLYRAFFSEPVGALEPKSVGYSREALPGLYCAIPGHFLRKKRWCYWAFTSQRHVFSFVVADTDYLGLASVAVIERFGGKAPQLYSETRPLGRGVTLPDTQHEDVSYSGSKLNISVQHRINYARTQGLSDVVTFSIDCDQFGDAKEKLEAKFIVNYSTDQEVLNVCVPWNASTFAYTSKQILLPVSGMVRVGRRAYDFTTEGRELKTGGMDDITAALQAQTREQPAFATRDFGRGVWPYDTAWNWASFSGTAPSPKDPKKRVNFGISVGGKWTDGTGVNENAVFIEKRMIKVHSDIKWDYDPSNWMSTWKLSTIEDGKHKGKHKTPQVKLELEFTPEIVRSEATNYVILTSSAHQVFGRFSGAVTVGLETYQISNMFGWAEQHLAKW